MLRQFGQVYAAGIVPVLTARRDGRSALPIDIDIWQYTYWYEDSNHVPAVSRWRRT